jgi:uncharacterized protein (DUF697 family)
MSIHSSCPKCHNEISEPTASFCPNCGDRLQVSAAGTSEANLPASKGVTAAFANKAMQLVNWVTKKAIAGVPPVLTSADDLAQNYLKDQTFLDHGKRIDSLINWETTKNFTSGFVTGLGGLLTLPITLPAAFGASWVIQARMAAAIANIGGHDIHDDRVQTFVVACLVGDAVKDMAKAAGLQIGKGFTKSLISKVPGSLLIKINQMVGFRLLTKAGQKGALNFIKAVPIVGGVVGGTLDAAMCQVVGKKAKELFHPESTEEKPDA